LTSQLQQNEVTIDGRLTLLPGSQTSKVTGLTLGTAGILDLGDNALVLDYTGASPVATVRDKIISGRGGPGFGATWIGPGINSSAAAAANSAEPESRSIGYADNAALPLGPYTTFRGQPVDTSSVLIAYTRTGDANLDGLVNDDDVTIVNATYAPGVAQPHWALGDFDYNGFVDDDDVTLLGAFYNPLAAQAPPAVIISLGEIKHSLAVNTPDEMLPFAEREGYMAVVSWSPDHATSPTEGLPKARKSIETYVHINVRGQETRAHPRRPAFQGRPIISTASEGHRTYQASDSRVDVAAIEQLLADHDAALLPRRKRFAIAPN
jgi:hypothetical protein